LRPRNVSGKGPSLPVSVKVIDYTAAIHFFRASGHASEGLHLSRRRNELKEKGAGLMEHIVCLIRGSDVCQKFARSDLHLYSRLNVSRVTGVWRRLDETVFLREYGISALIFLFLTLFLVVALSLSRVLLVIWH
jgi:hypothetical protein